MNSKAKPDPICEPCLAEKMHANPFLSSTRQSERLLQLIHSDVKHIGITSHGGYKYWVIFITDKGRFKCVIPLKLKSDTFAAFKQYKAWAAKLVKRLVLCNVIVEMNILRIISNSIFVTLVLNFICLLEIVHNKIVWQSVQIGFWVML